MALYKASLNTYRGPQDNTGDTLLNLAVQGYTTVTWQNRESSCDKCRALDGLQWGIEDFLFGTDLPTGALAHGASMYEHSHPGCYCTLVVSGPDLPEQYISLS